MALAARTACLLAALWTAAAAAAGEPPATPDAAGPIGELRFIGEQRIPHRQSFGGTTVGGLSGIDYDAADGAWILVSDDRTDEATARFYAATLSYGEQGFDAAALVSTSRFRQPDGAPYSSRWLGGELPDVEAVRIDPADGSLWYASEGDRNRGQDPFVRRASRAGEPLGQLPLPAMFRVQPGRDAGPYNNRGFEGLSFARDGRSLWLAMEGPLIQDGALPTPAAGAMARLTQLGRDGALLRQVAYPIDPIPAKPGPMRYADNGISEILAVDDRRLLVLERAAVQAADGRYTNYIRLYEADTSAASDVSAIASLRDAPLRPAAKRLVLDLNTLGLPRLDNLEGIAWGPRLANGHASLVLVSDDNFNPGQVTQLLAFEVLPR